MKAAHGRILVLVQHTESDFWKVLQEARVYIALQSLQLFRRIDRRVEEKDETYETANRKPRDALPWRLPSTPRKLPEIHPGHT